MFGAGRLSSPGSLHQHRARIDEVEALAPVVRDVMQGALKLDVPLDVDLKVGDDWESMSPVEMA